MPALRFPVFLTLGLLALGGCDTVGSLFGGEEEPRLPGTRVAVLQGVSGIEADPEVAGQDVLLPAPYVNGGWEQAGGSTGHAMYHLALGDAPQVVWSDNIGEGDDDDAALLSQPIVVGDTVFAMDARSTVTARRQGSGETFWEVDLELDEEDDGFFGGGIAFADGRLFVTTGFGSVFALEGTSGNLVWQQDLPAPIRSAPTVSGGRVFVITLDNQTFALAAADGRRLWDHSGITEVASLLGTTSPAVAGGSVIVGYTSGEIYALQVENGREIWSDSLAAVRRTDPLADIAQIRGLPVIDRGLVFVVSHAGRTVAIDYRRGSRVWERDFGGTQTPWAAGEYLFMITNDGTLLCLTREEGAVRWATQLPRWEDPEDLEDAIVWYGPVLASDRLVVAGSHGEAYAVSPYSGEILGVVDLPAGAAMSPIVANNTLYFISQDADLVSMR